MSSFSLFSTPHTYTLGKLHALLLLLFIYKYLSSSLLAFTFFVKGKSGLRPDGWDREVNVRFFYVLKGNFTRKVLLEGKVIFTKRLSRVRKYQSRRLPRKAKPKASSQSNNSFFCLLMFYPSPPTLLQI